MMDGSFLTMELGADNAACPCVVVLSYYLIMNVGQAIKMCRSRRGLSQVGLARRAQCSVSYLSMLENSQRDPTLSTVQKIALALDVPIGILFFLAADKDELSGIDQELASQLAITALNKIAGRIGKLSRLYPNDGSMFMARVRGIRALL